MGETQQSPHVTSIHTEKYGKNIVKIAHIDFKKRRKRQLESEAVKSKREQLCCTFTTVQTTNSLLPATYCDHLSGQTMHVINYYLITLTVLYSYFFAK